MTPPQQPADDTDLEWDRQVRDRLTACVPELLPGAPTVQSITSWAQDVWFVDLVGGGRIVAKHQFYGLVTRGTPWDLLQVEFDASRHLRACGCSVPVVFGVDPDAQLILLEFVGEHTLADWLASPDSPAAVGRHLARCVLRGLDELETALALPAFGAEARVVPGASRAELAAAWQPVAGLAADGLECLWQIHCGESAPADLQASVQALSQQLGDRPARLGLTDYQPANIVVDIGDCRVTFLELSKLGWDWTERRAVQYLTKAENGCSTLLDAASVHASQLDAGAVDGHHILFALLLARQRLVAGATDLSGLQQQLATSLSDDPVVSGIRRALQPLTTPRDTATAGAA